MYKKLVYLIMTVLLLSSLTFCLPIMKKIRAVPTEIIVPDDYPTIQEAIDNASAGDTIRVKSETYHEHIFINKSVKIVGENPLNTIIDGDGYGTVIHIDSPDVSIINFTIQNGGENAADFGVFLSESATNVTVRNNIIRNNLYGGLQLRRSTNNNIIDNKIVENFYQGVSFYDNSNDNNFIGNTVANNFYGMFIDSSSNITLYHNNFIDNNQTGLYGATNISWDNGAEGNYWSDYVGVDGNGDGIGDTPYPKTPSDEYPLIEPWSLIRVFDVYQNEEYHYVTVYCNSTVGWQRDNVPFFFNKLKKQISFNVTGPSDTTGFCNITIPKTLLWGNFTVLIDGGSPPELISSSNTTHNSFYFTYPLASTLKVKITGAFVVGMRAPVTLTIDAADPLKITLGKTITIKATLKDENENPIPNATIEFYLFEDGTWKTIGSSETDSYGVAVLEYKPSAAGTFYVKAEFPGTEVYGKTSDIITLIVNFDYTPYILVGVAIVAAIALIAFAIWRKRKKRSKS